MADQWFYRMFGEEFGPMPLEKLKELADLGTIQALDQVRASTTSEWVPAATIDQLGLSTSERKSVPAAVATSLSDFEIATPQAAINEWFCQLGDHELGPISFEELLTFAENEQLGPDDQVKLGSQGKWRRAGSIGRLMAAFPYQAAEKTIVRDTSRRTPDRPGVEKPAVETPQANSSLPAAVATADPDATYRVAYEQAKAKVAESMMAQADAMFKAAEDQALAQVAWVKAPNVDRYWWGWAGGVEFGPVEFNQVFGLARTGQLKPADFVRNGSHGQFVPSSTVPGLIKAIEILTQATQTRDLAKAQAKAAISLSAPADVAPAEVQKIAELAAATEAQEKRIPPVSKPAAEGPKSNPAIQSVRQSSRPGSDPQLATRNSSSPEFEDEQTSGSAPVESMRSSTPPSMRGGNSMSMDSGFSSMSSSSMSTYGSYRPAPTPAPVPSKSYPRKVSAPRSTWFSDTLESLKEPKAIGTICVVALAMLFFGWQYLPKSRSADIKRYQALKQLLDEIRTKRASAPAELGVIQQKLTKLGKEIAVELKDKAGPHDPAKQCLLWAARDEVPRLMTAGLSVESLAEKNLAEKLKEAAIELGLEKRPPIDQALLAARNNDD